MYAKMKRNLLSVLAALLLVPMGIFSQTYQQWWHQVEEAQQKDLPRTAIDCLQQIEHQATKELAYGQLLKATLLRARLQAQVAPDSLRPAVTRLEQQARTAGDVGLEAVYAAVLSQIYDKNHELGDDWQAQRDSWRQLALAQPEALGALTATAYTPFVIKGKDSELFGHDLLSVIGRELAAYDWLSRYYEQTGNRRAACLTALWHIEETYDEYQEKLAGSAYIRALDSLIERYGDLPEACEIAIERYDHMDDYTDATPQQKADWIQQSLKRWGTWRGANELRNSWSALTQPTFNANMLKEVMELNRPQTVVLTELRNLQSLTMRVFRTRLEGDTDLNPNTDEGYKKLKKGLTELKDHSRTLRFTGHEVYDVFEDSLTLDGLPAGVYMLEFSTQPQTGVERQLCYVSGLRVISEPQPNDRIRYVVVDATTGQPVPGAKLLLTLRKNWQKPATTKTLTADAQGEVLYKVTDGEPQYVRAYTAADKYAPESYGYGSYSYYDRKYDAEHTSLFTDRSIYRPGQTLHVAAIVWQEQSAMENKAVEGKRITIELRDANYKSVGEQQVVTDRFGKCAATFTLPTGQLNGRFTIRANGNSTSVRVEEYKRPTFQVEFPEYKEAYQAGDTVHVKAKAMTYSGVPVQGARVKYTVHRQVAYWWMTYSRYWQGGYFGNGLQRETLNEGEAVTQDDGSFVVDMPMVMPKGLPQRSAMFYNFVVEADVTDAAGETHSGTLSLPLGSKPTALTCDLPEQVRSDQLPAVTFHRRNAAGQPIEGTVRYRVQRLEVSGERLEVSGEKLEVSGEKLEDSQGWTEVAANESSSHLLSPASRLSSGAYRLEATCGDDTIEQKFVVFSLDDTKPATDTRDWFYVSHAQFPKDGAPVTVQVGSSDPDLHIVYGLFAGKKMIESGAVKKSGELINRQFTYQKEYGNGLWLTFAWVKDGQCYRHEQLIERPRPDKRLRLAWETFRDRLTPGQEEEWRLKVLQPDGTPASAQLMAVLYDKSLDQLQKHQWSFQPTSYLAQPSTRWQCSEWGGLHFSAVQNYKQLAVPSFAWSRFDGTVYPVYKRMMRIRGYGKMAYATAAAAIAPKAAKSSSASIMAMTDALASDESALEEVVVVGYGVSKKALKTGSVTAANAEGAEADAEPQTEEPQVQIRENLQETAFFYPQLEADKDGGVVLKFTLPESLTTWRFMGVSHTVDMLYGSIDGEAVAQKDVMIQPNVPRFVRMGDDASISARIFNTGQQGVTGTARLLLINPETDKTVFEQSQPFSVEQGKTAAAVFNVPCSKFDDYSLLVCKVVAVGDGFSDGEQHYLPVLSDRELVTRTIPFTQHEPGTKTIDLTQLFPKNKSLTSHSSPLTSKLTVEYTNNPAWLMVQSLPTLGQPWERSAIEQAAAYYSNTLAKTILAQNPQAKTTFAQWKQETGSEQTLMSQLQKDEELKDLVLAETPWVGSADREAEQRQRLADFFDENGINLRLSQNVEKLKKLQNGDGSFSWYPGMQGSTMVTAAVAEMLTRLSVMAGPQQDTKHMQAKALGYLGEEMVKLVDEMKKAEKKGVKPTFPTFTALRWLYISALDSTELASKVRIANDYLIALLKKDILGQSIYEKALTAVILAKHGERQKAAEYVQSLKEWSVYTEEMGRYYDTPRAGYSWFDYKIPTEVAAIEAIQRVTPQDGQTLDEMRRWLLQEKRTQAWSTPINSVNAIYAFLFDRQNVLAAQEQTVLAIDGKRLDLPKATAALGYVKTVVTPAKGKKLTARKSSTGTSWGAVYAQYLQPVTDIEASQSGITVKRELLTAHRSPLTSCKVGDRIKVRLTIDVSRDLDFVQVVDRRAACMEPVGQLSGYHNGAYVSPKDYATHYFYYGLGKGRHVIETEYYVDRPGRYTTGTCTVGCAYAPEFRATAPAMEIKVEE